MRANLVMARQACCFRGKEASCAMRQAPAVSFSSGELLLLSHSHVWNGVSDFYSGSYFGYSTLLSELDGGNCSYVDGRRSEESGEEATAQIMSQLGPVPSPGAISFTCAQLQGNLMAGVRGEDHTVAVAHGLPMVGRWRTARPRTGRLHSIATGCHVLCACFLLGVPFFGPLQVLLCQQNFYRRLLTTTRTVL